MSRLAGPRLLARAGLEVTDLLGRAVLVAATRGLASAAGADLISAALGGHEALDARVTLAEVVAVALVAVVARRRIRARGLTHRVDADLTSLAVRGAATLDRFTEPLGAALGLAAALVWATVRVLGATSDALTIDALAVVTLGVEDTRVILRGAGSVDADLIGGAVVAIDALGGLLGDALEVAANLTGATRLLIGALSGARRGALVVDAGLTDATLLGLDALELGVVGAGAVAIRASLRQALCGDADFLADVHALEADRAVIVELTDAAADLLAGLGGVLVVQADAARVIFDAVVRRLTRLAQASFSVVIGVVARRDAGPTDADVPLRAVDVTETIGGGGCARLRIRALHVAARLVPALVPTLPRVAVCLADLVVVTVLVTSHLSAITIRDHEATGAESHRSHGQTECCQKLLLHIGASKNRGGLVPNRSNE